MYISLADFLNEGLGSMEGFPQHWVRYLTKYQYDNLGGENSTIKNLNKSNIDNTIFKELKEDDAISIIIKINNVSTFMIVKYSDKLYNLFLKEKSIGHYGSYGLILYGNGKRNNRKTDFSIKYILNIINEKIGENDVIEIIVFQKDQLRNEKRKERASIKNVIDPLNVSNRNMSLSQQNRKDIYKQIKSPKLKIELEKTINDIKQQILDNFDNAISKVLKDVQNGYSWNIDNKQIGSTILNNIDLNKLKRISDAFSTLNDTNYKDAAKSAAILKKLGF